mmetsp:Transcript_9682/g.13555  ORF Transcript_9682/g.13555 Transcript_9682/m.13555 type:complete len:172 (-) Transcript_9682:309-824(-)|eukprot:CAMPEP_0185736522 /NCGR_PEP_ID=MMETSP1171-20130828/28108_1 /TAXON_ID=374046 /ORGANISM="Helicotheca tamensis, Strain CCMP826" /LENGTH=171 /DNA_ID=CAMNT_0028407167 /DNA_START=40 /DNA_END=555 /DNA_ORIENTATION=-
MTTLHHFIFLFLIASATALQLVTKTKVPGVSREQMHTFLATPTNWPTIVASSQSVRPSSGRGNPVDKPLSIGEEVDEIFGLPPILPLSVCWVCEKTDVSNGDLAFFSEQGLRNVANKCRMIFSIADDENGCSVDLKMEYEPVSPLAVMAVPVLSLDNALALKVLLPQSISN